MVDINDPAVWYGGFVAIAVFTFFYYRNMRVSQMRRLAKIGFRTESIISVNSEVFLRKLLDFHFPTSSLPSGTFASHNGLLIWYQATRECFNRKIRIWCFRRAEGTSQGGVERWWQAIHIKADEGANDAVPKSVISEYLGESANYFYHGEELLIVFPCKYFGFPKVIQFLNLFVREANKKALQADV